MVMHDGIISHCSLTPASGPTPPNKLPLHHLPSCGPPISHLSSIHCRAITRHSMSQPPSVRFDIIMYKSEECQKAEVWQDVLSEWQGFLPATESELALWITGQSMDKPPQKGWSFFMLFVLKCTTLHYTSVQDTSSDSLCLHWKGGVQSTKPFLVRHLA